MKIYELAGPPEPAIQRILRRREQQIQPLLAEIQPVLERIKNEGDQALLDLTLKFDNVKLTIEKIEVSEEDISIALKQIDRRLLKAIKVGIRNVWRFHEKQAARISSWFTKVAEGVTVGLEATPIDSVGIYVPAGKGRFPSVVPMLAVPAKLAGVRETIMCTPPIDGLGDPATLAAAHLTGVDRIFRLGGPQAIAAMAFGTRIVPKVAKIVGPGGPHIAAAKELVRSQVAIGTPAGPSETCILADRNAKPSFAAAEAVCEAEHGPDSSSIIVTPSRKVAEEALKRIGEIIRSLPEPRRSFATEALTNYGGIIVTDDLDGAIGFVNVYAPEHLVIMTSNPFKILRRIRNASAVFIGPYSSVGAGSYVTGSNSVLPTGGWAGSFSATTIHEFMKFRTVECVTQQGLRNLRELISRFADYENFPAHRLAVEARFSKS